MKNFLFLVLLVLAGTVNAQVKVIAHRGYWKAEGSAQNSIASIVKADEIGAYGSEFDVWRTKEGRYIVNHDRVINGVDTYADRYKQVRNLTLKNGEKMPSLRKFLRVCKKDTKVRLIFELKSLPTKEEERIAVRDVAKAVEKYGLLDRTDFIAFSKNACMAFREQLPEANVLYLGGDLTPAQIKELGLSGIDYSAQALKKHPEWIEEAHDLGLKVNVWTVNSEKDMKHFIKAGVDFITTDYPVVLQGILKEMAK